MKDNNTEFSSGNQTDESYILRDKILWVKTGQKEYELCGHLDVIGLARDEQNDDWTQILEMIDGDGHFKQIEIPKKLFAGEPKPILEKLLSSGLEIKTRATNYKKSLIDYLYRHPCKNRIRYLKRIGWHENVFMIPDKHFGSAINGETLLLASKAKSYSKYSIQGTLEEWRDEVALPCKQNSRLVFSLSMPFAAPLIYLLGQESGGFHFFGSTSVGKTTALCLAGSVLGNPMNGYIQQWRTTQNAGEYLCAGHNDSLLIMDEISQCSPEDVGRMIYQISNNMGKRRANADDTLRLANTWRLLILSSGEFDIKHYLESSAKRAIAKGGQLARLIDVPADAGTGHGIFNSIGPHASGHEFSISIKEAVEKNHGTAIHGYLSILTNQISEAKIKALKYQTEFVNAHNKSNLSGEVKRQLMRFGIVYAGGRLAIDYNILPLTELDIKDACDSCFNDSLLARGGSEASEDIKVVEHIRYLLTTFGNSKFEPLDSELNAPRVNERWGYVRRGIFTTWYIPKETFREVFCKDFNFKQVTTALLNGGYLEKDSEGKSSVSITTPDHPKIRVYAINSTILEGNYP